MTSREELIAELLDQLDLDADDLYWEREFNPPDDSLAWQLIEVAERIYIARLAVGHGIDPEKILGLLGEANLLATKAAHAATDNAATEDAADNADENRSTGVENIDHIEPEVDTDLNDSLDFDLGVDDELATRIRETDGVDPAESPLLSERLAAMNLRGQIIVALLKGRDLNPDDLLGHLKTIEDIERSALLKEVELVGDESDGDH